MHLWEQELQLWSSTEEKLIQQATEGAAPLQTLSAPQNGDFTYPSGSSQLKKRSEQKSAGGRRGAGGAQPAFAQLPVPESVMFSACNIVLLSEDLMRKIGLVNTFSSRIS